MNIVESLSLRKEVYANTSKVFIKESNSLVKSVVSNILKKATWITIVEGNIWDSKKYGNVMSAISHVPPKPAF